MTVHLEGMGWLGAATAFALHRENIDFTWHDTNSPFTAWKASTGIVYPAGDTRSRVNLNMWRLWHDLDLFPPATVVPATYCFAHKNPPHAGQYSYDDLGWIKVAHAPAYAVDVAAIVRAAREVFADREKAAERDAKLTFVTHGFNQRLASYMWGWSAKVRVALPEPLASGPYPNPALYGRLHRFAITYLYPVPSEPGWWWAGSTLARQKTPTHSDAAKRFESWCQAAGQLYPGLRILEAQAPVEGWRPRPQPTDEQRLQTEGGRVLFPPLWHSGVRWAPDLVMRAVGIAADEASRG